VAQGRQEGGLAEAHAAAGFKVLPRRWVVERTFSSWLSQNRRMSKDYERLCATTGEAFVYAAMTRLMVKRLTRA
jgi:putative transposase